MAKDDPLLDSLLDRCLVAEYLCLRSSQCLEGDRHDLASVLVFFGLKCLVSKKLLLCIL